MSFEALDIAIADARSPEQQAALVVALAARLAALGARMTTGGVPVEAPSPDENVSATEAARRLGVSRVYLYRHAHELPFAVRIGRRVVFSAKGLERWSRQQRGVA